MLVETLRADWTARATNARVRALPEFENGALALGAGTKLAEVRGDRRDAATEGERAVALVSVALGRPLDASSATHVRRALAKAREGDAPLALTHLALAGVGRLTDPRDDARRLFIADGLMKGGVAPRTILAALGATPAQADLDRAYNPRQPRVPPGNGRPSGQWTSGNWQAEASVSAHVEAPPVQVAEASTTRGHEVRSDTALSPTAAPNPEPPSVLQSLLTSFENAVPGAFYGNLAADAARQGDYYQAGLYEAAALLEAAAAVVTLDASEAEIAARRAAQLAANKLAGKAFEDATAEGFIGTGIEYGPQVTIKTQSGASYKLDFMTRDPETGVIGCVECKSSPTAGFTPNQLRAIPEIEDSGATVVGAGKPGFPGGMNIPPTTVQVIRGPK